MAKRESTAAGDTEEATDETEESSLDPFPEVGRNAGRTTTSEERTVDSETESPDQTDEDREAGDKGHGCDHDSDVPCRFQ